MTISVRKGEKLQQVNEARDFCSTATAKREFAEETARKVPAPRRGKAASPIRSVGIDHDPRSFAPERASGTAEQNLDIASCTARGAFRGPEPAEGTNDLDTNYFLARNLRNGHG
jgi:hypothetical protein